LTASEGLPRGKGTRVGLAGATNIACQKIKWLQPVLIKTAGGAEAGTPHIVAQTNALKGSHRRELLVEQEQAVPAGRGHSLDRLLKEVDSAGKVLGS
jgi:hypothetical protein